MGESHAAAGIAMAMVRKLGAHRALWITTLSCALLTYGGVVVCGTSSEADQYRAGENQCG